MIPMVMLKCVARRGIHTGVHPPTLYKKQIQINLIVTHLVEMLPEPLAICLSGKKFISDGSICILIYKC